jgi:ubiquinone/menaquinone biosynthesis C-methylase UbiE
MRRFKSASFDFAMFALNGLDYVSHDDRLTILREVHRLLKPGGRFLFSSHNREWEFLPEMRKWPWQRNENPWTRAFWSACLVGLVERPRLKRYEIEENEYAILNVREGNYRLLTTHTTISAQKAQLENVGFKLASLYDNKTGGPVSEPRRFNWIYYLAVKPVVDAEACCSG